MKLLEEFFSYARERENIRLRRASGAPAPWTEDLALRHYRFCNVFREDDVVTQWIRKYVREPLSEDPHVLWAMIMCRWINRISTLEKILEYLLDLQNWNKNKVAVYQILNSVQPIVGGAYMIRTPKGYNKAQGLIKVFDMFANGEGKDICAAIRPGITTLQFLHSVLTHYQMFGDFMAYEVVTDMRHTSWLNKAPDIMTWAVPGPGARRGVGRLLHDDHKYFHEGKLSEYDRKLMLDVMRELLKHSQDPKLWPWQDRPWEMREVEHTLCEFDKWQRTLKFQGEPKQRFLQGSGI